jgi:hypothetical protein
MEVREIFENQAFGELERLVTQTLLDVTQGIAREELGTENWPRNAAKLRRQSHEEMRAITLDFLDTDVFNISIDHCAAFLEPMIDSWDIDLKTFGMEIELNKGFVATEFMKFQFVETGGVPSSEEEPGFQEFLGNAALSGDATGEEVEFLKNIRFRQKRPSALYYYRELQSLRDPLHFLENSGPAMHKQRDASDIQRLLRMESRKSAIRRWTRNRKHPGKLRREKPA